MSIRVLIAEDEPHIIESLSFVLGREGFDVSAVLDGESVIEHLRSERPNVVILDVMLPQLNGFEVLKRIKSDPSLASIPVIILTAKGQAQDRRTAEELGADRFVTKPYANAEVVGAVRDLMGVAPATE